MRFKIGWDSLIVGGKFTVFALFYFVFEGKIALKYEVKQSKNGKFTSNYKVVQSICKRKFPSVEKPLRI